MPISGDVMKSELVIRGLLDTDERILWSGQPKRGVLLRAADIFLIPFSLLWGGFAFYGEYVAVSHGAPAPFSLFGIPFVVAGIYLIAGRFFVDAKLRGNTYYAVTTNRIVIVSGIIRRTVQSLALRNLLDISMTEYSNGSGSIYFGRPMALGSMYEIMMWPGVDRLYGPRFSFIADAKRVYGIIREAQSKI